MDSKIVFKSTSRGPRHDACRGAVLFPLVKRARLRGQESRSSLKDRHEVLQRIWRVRASVLCQKGWDGLKGLRLQYVRNCPPFSVGGFTEILRPCHMARICPSCYAREVVAEIFRCVEFALYMGRSKPLPGFTAMAFRRTWEFPADRDPAALLKLMAKDRRYEADNIKERGTIILSLLEPIPTGWKVTRSVIAVIREGDVITKDRFSNMNLRTLSRKTKGQLSKMVAWAAKYPTGLLFGDDDRTVDLILASWNQQMFTTSGLMRNKKFRECLQ